MDLSYSTTRHRIRNRLYPSPGTVVTSSCFDVFFHQGSKSYLVGADEFKILELLFFIEKHTQKHAANKSGYSLTRATRRGIKGHLL